ncbi:hypothetical protein A2U01_0053905, partial [Trifolium medium]|nr:hypothetical protein [Trifolium medium]
SDKWLVAMVLLTDVVSLPSSFPRLSIGLTSECGLKGLLACCYLQRDVGT